MLFSDIFYIKIVFVRTTKLMDKEHCCVCFFFWGGGGGGAGGGEEHVYLISLRVLAATFDSSFCVYKKKNENFTPQ